MNGFPVAGNTPACPIGMNAASSMPLSLQHIRQVPVTAYPEARATIRTGDLLFCCGAEPLSRIIQTATRSPYSHVALVVRMLTIDRLLLLEAEWPYGVRVVPMSSYFSDWNGSGKAYPGHLLVARHAALDVENEQVLPVFLSELVDALGRPYSLKRLLRIGLREAAALLGMRFRQLHMRKATVCSEYVYHALSRAGIDLPWNNKGCILPHDIASNREMELLCRML